MKDPNLITRGKKGLTLIELLITIAVSTIIIGVVVLTMKTAIDTYTAVQDSVFLQKILDETLQTIAEGDFESYGIHDALEIIEAAPESITFVPLWIDDSHTIKTAAENKKQEFILNRPFKAGAGLPLGEILVQRNAHDRWEERPVTLQLHDTDDPASPPDTVYFSEPFTNARKVRFVYHPDTTQFPNSQMKLTASPEGFLKTYKDQHNVIPKYNTPRVTFPETSIQYFDNTNTELLADSRTKKIPIEQLLNITAVKVTIRAALNGRSKQGSVFLNIRNTRTIGSGLIIRQGTTLKIPNSSEIRAFSLVNIAGVRSSGHIKLKASSDAGRTWVITAELGRKDGKEMIERYSVEYLEGNKVYSEQVNLTTDLPLNFLTVGTNGRYDYDLDKQGDNVVNLEGEVTLTVLEMGAAGASIFIRP